MKVQCEKCKEIVGFEFAIDGAGIRVTCPGCGASYRVEAAPAAAAAPAPVAAPVAEVTCPKCGHGQAAAEACRKCGLVFAKWDPAKVVPLGDATAAELWAKCEADWGDDGRHTDFIEHCRRVGVLAYAAARYRQRGGEEERLQLIRSLAEQTLAATPRTELPMKKSRMVQYVLVGVLLATLLTVVARFLVP